jgi:hypothetical protein
MITVIIVLEEQDEGERTRRDGNYWHFSTLCVRKKELPSFVSPSPSKSMMMMTSKIEWFQIKWLRSRKDRFQSERKPSSISFQLHQKITARADSTFYPLLLCFSTKKKKKTPKQQHN